MAKSVIGGTASVLGGGKFENGAITAAFGYLFNELQHLLDGRIAHHLLQGYYEPQGYEAEQRCLSGTDVCVGAWQRFDLADPGTQQLWEIKRDSIWGSRSGESQLSQHTNGTGFVRGGSLPALTVNGATLSLGAGDTTYVYSDVGGGLITYQVISPPGPIERFFNQLGRALANNPPFPVPGAPRHRDGLF